MKIDILTINNLLNSNGVNSFINTLYQEEVLFRENDIELNNILGYQKKIMNLKKINCESKIIKKPSKLKQKIKNKIENLAENSRFLSLILIYYKYILRAKKMMKEYKNMENKSKYVIINDVFTAYFYLKMVARNNKIFLILHTNGETFAQINTYYKKQFSFLREYLIKIEKFTCEKVNKIIFVSDTSKKSFLIKNKEKEKKVVTVYNGLKDVKKIPEKQIGKVINFVCIGTFNGRKGQELIIKAVSELNEQYRQNMMITFVGGGPYLEKAKEMKNKNDDNIFFLGERKDIVDILQKQDIFILASSDEGLPIAIIEAMRQNKPIITTNVGGISEMVINKKNGIFIERDIKEIKKGILYFLENKEEIKKMGEYSREVYERRFSSESMIKKYIQLIKEEEKEFENIID